MSPLAVAAVIIAVSLLTLKLAYVASVVAALPKTGGAMFCITGRDKIRAVLDALPMTPDTNIIDLGCGDARFIAAAARRYGCRGRGYDINWGAFLLAKIRQAFSGGLMTVRRQDFWPVPLGHADVVFCYLFPDLMERLGKKARAEMKPGSVLVSCNFELPGWRPEHTIYAGKGGKDPIYIYRQEGDAHER